MESRSWYETQRELDRIAAPQAETADNRPARRRKAALDRKAGKPDAATARLIQASHWNHEVREV